MAGFSAFLGPVFWGASGGGAVAAAGSVVATREVKKEVIDKPAEAAKRGRNEAIRRKEVAMEKAGKEAQEIGQRSDARRTKRREDVGRNVTKIANPLGIGEQADVIRKTLTGS